MKKGYEFFGRSEERDFLVDEMGLSRDEAELITPQPPNLSEPNNISFTEVEKIGAAYRKYMEKDLFFSRYFGRIDLSEQGSYKEQHRNWFSRADTLTKVRYLKGSIPLAHDIMILGKNTVISVTAFLECLTDNAGIRKRVYNSSLDYSDMYKILRNFLEWHFEEIEWGDRD